MQNNKKTVYSRAEAIDVIKSGISRLAMGVKCTLGPLGGLVVIGTSKIGHMTKDGVTVARNMAQLEDAENTILNIFRQGSIQSERDSGDGTTSTIVLMEAFALKALEHLETKNRYQVKQTLESVKGKLVNKLTELSKPCQTKDDMLKVAMISSNGDYKMANRIVEVVSECGAYGKVEISKSPTEHDDHVVTNGYRVDRGFINSSMKNSVDGRFKADFANIIVAKIDLVNEGSAATIPYMLSRVTDNSKPTILFVKDYQDAAVEMCVNIAQQYGQTLVIVRIPSGGFAQEKYAEDLGVLSLAEQLEAPHLNAIYMEMCQVQAHQQDNTKPMPTLQDWGKFVGQGKDIIIDERTSIISVLDNKTLTDHIASLREQLVGEHEAFRVELLNARIGLIDGKPGTIYVGGKTEVDQNERIDRYDDAVRALQSALKHGMIHGGGYSYLDCISELEGDEAFYAEPLKIIFKQILINAEFEDSEIIDHMEKYMLDGTMIDPCTRQEQAKGIVMDSFRSQISAIECAIRSAQHIVDVQLLVLSPTSDSHTYAVALGSK